jgi:hypothetical protein
MGQEKKGIAYKKTEQLILSGLQVNFIMRCQLSAFHYPHRLPGVS